MEEEEEKEVQVYFEGNQEKSGCQGKEGRQYSHTKTP
jgi:hypothetical protein